MALKYFATPEDALAYGWTQMLSSLRDDLARMERDDYEHYADEDRQIMADKISDLEEIKDLITSPKMGGRAPV